MLNITVSNQIHIPMHIPEYETILEQIREHFVYENPVFHAAKERGYKTRGIDPLVQNWNFSLFNWKQYLSIPRGGMTWLKQFLTENRIAFEIEDERARGTQIEVEWNDKYTPHDYQLKGFNLLSKFQQGFWCYNPGAGKTILGLYSISQIKRATLIIVNSNELANQWKNQIQEFLRYDDEVGLIQQQKCNIKPITIALIQTLNNWNEKKIESLNKYFGFLMHDEAHHSPADSNQKVLNKLSQKYRMALTASKKRKDKLEFLAYDYYDSIRQIETGNVMTPTVQMINTGFQYPWTRSMKWQEFEKILSNDYNRNQLIKNEIHEHVVIGHKVLSLWARNDSAKHMNQLLLNEGIRSRCLISGEKFNLNQIKNEIASGKIQVIVGCKMFDEGIDIPALSSIHLCSPSSNEESVRQRTGRITRNFNGKLQPIITDYKDDVTPCKTSANKRLEWYRDFGYNVPSTFMGRTYNLGLW